YALGVLLQLPLGGQQLLARRLPLCLRPDLHQTSFALNSSSLGRCDGGKLIGRLGDAGTRPSHKRVPHNRRPQARTYGNGRSEMRVLLSTYGSRGDVEPMVRSAEQSRALRAEGCDALVATGVTPAAVWR